MKPSPFGRGLAEGLLARKPSPLAPLPEGEGNNTGRTLYHFFVTTGLFPLAIAIIICTIGVINSRAHVDPTGTQSPQEQMQFPEGLDYSKFQHSSRNHSRLPCLLCHRRDSNAPVPKRPGASQHLPCAGCHAQQFSNSESPICTICHTDVKSGALKPFPTRLISFRMKFDHAKHLAMGSVSCATCHRQARGGVAMTIPADFNAH
ncbi:MAG TPA: hypothetical protein VE863_15145, partial [Pyrinomonadaceae bacterium]|nr:hypothetical protein [Pyrinomonadaceae bacterium]